MHDDNRWLFDTFLAKNEAERLIRERKEEMGWMRLDIAAVEAKLNGVDVKQIVKDVEEIKRRQIPTWMWATLVAMMGPAVLVIGHYWK